MIETTMLRPPELDTALLEDDRVAVGVGADDRPVWVDWTRASSVLLVGTVGAGKSLLAEWIATVAHLRALSIHGARFDERPITRVLHGGVGTLAMSLPGLLPTHERTRQLDLVDVVGRRLELRLRTGRHAAPDLTVFDDDRWDLGADVAERIARSGRDVEMRVVTTMQQLTERHRALLEDSTVILLDPSRAAPATRTMLGLDPSQGAVADAMHRDPVDGWVAFTPWRLR